MPYTASLKHRTNQLLPVSDGEEPSLHFRWWYVVRLLQWHHAEGLLLPSVVIDWVLHQLQEKQLLEIWQLLLPIVYGFLEIVVLSQTYVRTLTGVALRIIRDPAPGGSDLVDNSRRAYTAAALIEMLRYLILAVPETFVALDCFPLPSSVVSHAINDENLTKAVSPGYPGDCLAKAAQALDNSLVLGDIHEAYKFLFEDLYDGPATDVWVAKVSPCLRLSLK
ncbi:mediator of RNA polymerase II transcription subunit, partial [Trifolium medium]|nr:mediator of RNA polymerase II transcription subunit [Trifolium medium]